MLPQPPEQDIARRCVHSGICTSFAALWKTSRPSAALVKVNIHRGLKTLAAFAAADAIMRSLPNGTAKSWADDDARPFPISRL
jgi:hypothetical protein